MSTTIEEVQSWWQVPAIAHFCNIFQTAFDICEVEIGELETALLGLQDPDICLSLEQIVIPILQGCFKKGEVNEETWEEKLLELFEENLDTDENPLIDSDFSSLTPKDKVDAIYKLCEFRLDVDSVVDVTKDVAAESMQATCVGHDANDHIYWYFFDERLYKEDPKAAKNLQVSQAKRKSSTKSTQKQSKKSARTPKPKKSEEIPWCITCHNSGDWENLLKQFAKTKHPGEKAIVKQIKEKYLPLLENIVAQKEKRLRKRLLDLAPKRSSARIGKVQEKRKLEEQIAAEAAEKYRLKRERTAALKEEKRKEEILFARQRRAEEREKKNEERALARERRIEKRSLLASDSDSNSQDYSKPFKAKEVWHNYIRSHNPPPEEIPDESSSELAEDEEENPVSSPLPKKLKIYDPVREDFENSVSVSERTTSLSSPSVRTYTRPSVIQASHSFSIWNPELSCLGPALKLQSNPVSKKTESSAGETASKVETDQSKKSDNKVIYYVDSNSLPFRQRNVNNSFAQRPSTTAPSVIRINIIKSPPINAVSRQVQSFPTTTFTNQTH